jgi:DNA primase
MINSPVDEIKNRIDIIDVVGSYIKLQKAGANYRACCPFHNEKKPSFFVNPSRQIWHCFGACGVGGDIFKFVMMIEGVEFGDALRILAKKAGVELKKQDSYSKELNSERERLYEVTELACCFFEKQLESNSGKEAKDYLLKRGVSEESIKSWRVGYAPDIYWDSLCRFLEGQGYKKEEIEKAGLCLKSQKTGSYYDRFRGRIIFPICDLSSQVVGFGGRIFKNNKRADGSEEAKYINSPATLLYDKSRILYGLYRAGLGIRKNNFCILVEGYMDAIMATQAGSDNVVATSGTALTSYQLKILKRYSDNLCTSFDMDLAGDSATKRGIDLAQAEGFNIKIVVMPKGDKDPADVVLENPSQWQELVKKAQSIHDFYFSTTLSRFNKNNLEGKKEISKIFLPVIKRISNKIEQGVWIKDLSEAIGVKEEHIMAELDRVVSPKNEFEEERTNEKPPVIKSRRDLLEERIASLLVRSPKVCSLVNTDLLKDFSLGRVGIIDYLIKNNGIVSDNIPNELKEKVNYICLLAESDLNETDSETELKDCLFQLMSLNAKEQLTGLSKEIKEAEKENNLVKTEELIQKFYQKAYAKEENNKEKSS